MCQWCYIFCFFKRKTAYDVRISDWSSDVCSSDLTGRRPYVSLLDEDRIEIHLNRREITPEHLAHGPMGGGPASVQQAGLGHEEGAAAHRCGAPGLDRGIAQPLHQVDTVDHCQIGRASCRERVCQYV